jgi:LDH2 family malate/lactate/ureidoglycolate dehydrogenase
VGHDLASRPNASNDRLGSRAAGRIRTKANEGLPCPPGWGTETRTGSPAPTRWRRARRRVLTSLGGSPENSSYNGYGLAVIVNILGSCLSGATLITDPMHTKKPYGNDIGRCLIAIDPGLFRDREESPPT